MGSGFFGSNLGAQERGLGRFGDLADLEHACRDQDVFDRAIGINNLDALEIGLDDAQGFADDLGTRAAFAADHTASFIFAA